jgi:hypothetical protein
MENCSFNTWMRDSVHMQPKTQRSILETKRRKNKEGNHTVQWGPTTSRVHCLVTNMVHGGPYSQILTPALILHHVTTSIFHGFNISWGKKNLNSTTIGIFKTFFFVLTPKFPCDQNWSFGIIRNISILIFFAQVNYIFHKLSSNTKHVKFRLRMTSWFLFIQIFFSCSFWEAPTCSHGPGRTDPIIALAVKTLKLAI